MVYWQSDAIRNGHEVTNRPWWSRSSVLALNGARLWQPLLGVRGLGVVGGTAGTGASGSV